MAPLRLTRVGLAALVVAGLAGCEAANVVSQDEMANRARAEINGMGTPSAINVVEIDLRGGLARALPGAVGASSRYRASLAAVAEAEARGESAGATLRPQVSLGATVGGIREGSTATRAADTVAGAAGNLNVSQLVFDGGLSASRVNEATARSIGADWSRVATGSEVALAAATAWINLWVAQQRSALLSDQTDQLAEIITQLERMSESGMIDRTALDAARRSLLDLDVARATLEQSKSGAEAAFRRYFKALPDGAISLPEHLSTAEAATLCAQWERAPELQIAAADLLAARSAVAAAEAAFQPQASLRGGVTSPMNRDDSTDINLGVAVSYDVSRGGARQAELEAARSREASADAALDEAEAQLKNELSDLRDQLHFLEERAEVLNSQADLSGSQLRDALSQIATGQSSLSEILSTRVTEYGTRDGLLQLRGEIATLKYVIASRVGRLAEDLGL